MTLDVRLPSTSLLIPRVTLVDSAGNEIADEDGDASDGHFMATLAADGDYYAKLDVAYWVYQGDRYYRDTSSLNWTDARAFAQGLGGDLVTINDQAENDWLREKLYGNFWIGLNDIDTEGTHVWASGEPVTYTNWGVNSRILRASMRLT